MSLVTEIERPRIALPPRIHKWDDIEYQFTKGKQLGEKFKQSLITGVPLRYSPILKAVYDSKNLVNVAPRLMPDEEHHFSIGFSDAFGLEKVAELAEHKHDEVPVLYLAGGTIELQPIRNYNDYHLPQEERCMRDGVVLPAVRVVFQPSDI